MQIVWAKAGRGIWGPAHVFEGKLYFTKDVVDDNSVPRNRKPKAISKPEAKAALIFLIWVGGWVGGSAGAGQQTTAPPPPLARGSLSNSLV